MAIPDYILLQMATRYRSALVRKNGCFFLNDKMPNIDYDKQRNQYRIIIRKYKREYKCTARRIAIYLHTGRLPDQPVYVTCSNFDCVNPLHLKFGVSGERSRVKNSKRDTRREYQNRKVARTGGRSTGGKSTAPNKQPYRIEIYSETIVTSDPSQVPLWADLDTPTINVKSEPID